MRISALIEEARIELAIADGDAALAADGMHAALAAARSVLAQADPAPTAEVQQPGLPSNPTHVGKAAVAESKTLDGPEAREAFIAKVRNRRLDGPYFVGPGSAVVAAWERVDKALGSMVAALMVAALADQTQREPPR